MLKFVSYLSSSEFRLTGLIWLGFMGTSCAAAAQTSYLSNIAKVEAKIQAVKPDFYFVKK